MSANSVAVVALDLHKKFTRAVTMDPGGEVMDDRRVHHADHSEIQLEPGRKRTLGLLAVYRDHDFVGKAYGNYWGLCNLIRFLAKETRSRPGRPVAEVTPP